MFDVQSASQTTKSPVDQEIESILIMTDYLMRGRKWDYIAGPVSSGPRFIKWYRETGHAVVSDHDLYNRMHYDEVIVPNQQEMCKFARSRLRNCWRSEAVYCPAELYFPHWQHEDYMKLCHQIIARYVSCMVFMSGWHLSYGNVQEFVFARQRNLAMVNDNNRVIDPDIGRELITTGLAKLTAAGLSTDKFIYLLNEL